MSEETEGDYKEIKRDNSIGKIWKEEGKKFKFSKDKKKKRKRKKVERVVYDERKEKKRDI